MSEAELKARIAALEVEVAALKPKLAPPPPAPDKYREGEVLITYPPAQTGFIEPTAEQLRKLLDLVFAKHPTLARRLDDSSQTFDSIRQCMFALGVMKRTTEIDYSKSAGVWISYVEKILSEHRRSVGHVHTAIFAAAALCHNDIAIGFQWAENGLHDFIGMGYTLSPYIGTPATNEWQRVLSGSAPLRNLVRPTTNTETLSPVRISRIGA